MHGPTTLIVIDLPPLSDTADSAARVVVAANGASPGWRSAPLLASRDGGATYDAIGATALPATIGRTVTALGGAGADLIDRINSVEVVLVNATLSLRDADTDALLAGANLAMIGNECVQYGRALAVGANRWRLSELWRGRRGTEAAISGHAADESFVVIDLPTLAALPNDYATDGLRVVATGIGDGAAIPVVLSKAGASVTPLSPVRVASAAQGGDIVVSWVRRSREGWRWDDAIDAPIGEERELYRVTRTGASVDTESRAAIAGILAALRGHGLISTV